MIETIPKFDRSKSTLEIVLPGIRSLHSFTVHDGGILASQLTCQSCTVSSLCSSCQLSSPAVPERKVLEAWRILEQSRTTGSDEDDSNIDDDDSEEESELEDNASESEDDLGSDTSENVEVVFHLKKIKKYVVFNFF